VIGVSFDGKLEKRIVVQPGEGERIHFVLPSRQVNRNIGCLAGYEMIAFGFLHAELFDVVRDLFNVEDFDDRFHTYNLQKIIPCLAGIMPVNADDLADPGSSDGQARLLGGGRYPANGFVPGMQREGELPPVDGHQGGRFEVPGGLDGLFRHHVDKGPVLMVLAAFEDGQIEGTETFADALKMLFVAGVAAEEQFIARCLQHERGPDGTASPKSTAGEMTAGGCGKG